MRSHLGCETYSVSSFLQVSQIFQKRKSDANKLDFENKLNLTCQAQSTPKTSGILTKVFSISSPNLVALAWAGDELSRGQAQNGVNVDFEVCFDLQGQGQSPPKTKRILTKFFFAYGPNLVILAWTGDEFLRGQTWWRTDGLTDGQTRATTIPEGQYWPRVIKTYKPCQSFQWDVQCSHTIPCKVWMFISRINVFGTFWLFKTRYIVEGVAGCGCVGVDVCVCVCVGGGGNKRPPSKVKAWIHATLADLAIIGLFCWTCSFEWLWTVHHSNWTWFITS